MELLADLVPSPSPSVCFFYPIPAEVVEQSASPLVLEGRRLEVWCTLPGSFPACAEYKNLAPTQPSFSPQGLRDEDSVPVLDVRWLFELSFNKPGRARFPPAHQAYLKG